MGLLDGAAPRRLAVTEIVADVPSEPTLAEQLRWARQFLVPWFKRRIRRESSGVGVAAKLPAYQRIS